MKKPPLLVDLDGTLIKTDLLFESFLALIRRKPLYLFVIPFWLFLGRAKLKAKIAEKVELDIGALPLNKAFFVFLEEEKKAGRELILATASNEKLANAVASYHGIFDQVIASTSETNLKSKAKLKAIKRHLKTPEFAYAGNETADLDIWEEASECIVVNAKKSLLKSIKKETSVFDLRTSSLKPLVKELRIYQWVKNLLIFLPLILAHRLTDVESLLTSIIAFFSFSFCASSVYLLNDLLDLQADRRHKTKKNRPFAAGTLSISWGFLLIPLLLGASLFLALKINTAFITVLGLYYLLTTSYSFYLKKRLAIDVILLSSLYTIRILAGGVAGDIVISEWLLSFSTFIFLSLALAKRYAELIAADLKAGTSLSRRGYLASDLETLSNLGTSSGYLSVLVFALYINSSEITSLYKTPETLWLLCPLFLYWISRFWIFASRGWIVEDPIVVAVKDKISWIVGFLSALFIYLAR